MSITKTRELSAYQMSITPGYQLFNVVLSCLLLTAFNTHIRVMMNTLIRVLPVTLIWVLEHTLVWVSSNRLYIG